MSRSTDMNGWEFLNSRGSSEASYNGTDGSWGYWNSDGSGSFNGADGSWGYRDADGSGSYNGADGSWGYWNADGSKTFYDSDGNSIESEEEDETASSGGKLSFGTALLGTGLLAAVVAAERAKDNRAYEAQQQYEAQRQLKEQREKARIRRKKRRAWQKQHWKGLALSCLIVVIALFTAIASYEFSKMISFSISSEELIGLNYMQAKNRLADAGFTTIRVKEIKDLDLKSLSEKSLVSNVDVLWYDDFDALSNYPSNAPITITYHSSKILVSPISPKDAKGNQYTDVIAEFKEAGFEQIETDVQYDIVTGWLKDDGEVSAVSINGEDDYEVGTTYEVDAQVVVTYHTLRKNKPD